MAQILSFGSVIIIAQGESTKHLQLLKGFLFLLLYYKSGYAIFIVDVLWG